ncbi:MAG: DUF4398 domain-containing protein [Candidatus Delongbacteria bacterium]
MRIPSLSKLRAVALVATVALLAVGCASTPLHTEASTSGIRAAESLGAADVPEALRYLQLAREELSRAKGLSQKNDHAAANSMLLRAEADAELAVLLSREDAVKIEAMDAIEQVRHLRLSNR